MRINKNPRCIHCGGLTQKFGFVPKVGGIQQQRFRCSKCGKTLYDTPDLPNPKYVTMTMKDKNGVHEVYSCWICGHIVDSKEDADKCFEECQKKHWEKNNGL